MNEYYDWLTHNNDEYNMSPDYKDQTSSYSLILLFGLALLFCEGKNFDFIFQTETGKGI